MADPADMSSWEMSAATVALHADHYDLDVLQDVAPPLHVSTNYRYGGNPDELVPIPERKNPDPQDYYYSRIAAPNTVRLETVLSSVVHAETTAYASGLAAFHAVLLLLNPRKVSIREDFYFGCHGVIDVLSRISGMKKVSIDCPGEELEAGDLIMLETPLSPSGEAFSIAQFAKKAKSRGAYLLVSSTLAPPCLQDPFEWGADLVMHSGSKYIGGHHDTLCGFVATRNSEWTKQLRRDRQLIGSAIGNLESWLCLRSIRTMDIRVRRQSETTQKLVDWLESNLAANQTADLSTRSSSDSVHVSTVAASVQHTSLQKEDFPWLKLQMPNGFGSVFSITMKTPGLARHLPSQLKLFTHATSLGGVESTVEWRKMSDTKTNPCLLRFSIGLEDWQDLRLDLLQAFKTLALSPPA